MDDFDMVTPAGPGSNMSQKGSWIAHPGQPILRGNACMMLASWEAAEPVTESYEARTTLNPDSYAWAAFALFAQAKWARDLSSGVCRL